MGTVPGGFRIGSKVQKSVTPDAAWPAKVKPKHSAKVYEGKITTLTAAKDTFGFSVHSDSMSSEIGFYVDNDSPSKTLIETVMLAVKMQWTIRVYYDDTTFKADSVQIWGS